MGRRSWRKHIHGEPPHRQPGCFWRLFRVLDYHCWYYNVLKINQRHKYKLPRDDKYKPYGHDGYETEKLSSGDDSPRLVKALIDEDVAKENANITDKEGFYIQKKLQETYSVPDLESMNVDWKPSLILLPGNVKNYVTQSVDTPASKEEASDGKSDVNAEKSDYKENPGILEIFKVDKGLLVKHLHDADENIAKFSRTALGLNAKLKLSRSRSFPQIELSKGKKLIPMKPESKRREVWSLLRDSVNVDGFENVETLDDNIAMYSVCDGCMDKDSDLYYIRHLLHQSGIAADPYEIIWHASDQPLSPNLFKKVETFWHHEKDQFNGWSDFYGCWHHQMLFDLVNEVILEVYDESLPYYPKALSSSCDVRPLPLGNWLIEEVSACISTFLNLKPEETAQSVKWIMARDLARDRSWMNLQLETECIGIEIEDMIFEELLEEVLTPGAC